ncbi:MAG TPA: DivIVA domain-containing protein [Jatrophihabitantaceae bacterium]|jgi:DivIVA domain-containing protein|nr:DivIVA domain-containing protein [Jatrophihabitantaceae bacterium]
MPLTPAEVHNVAFKKPPIGKRGYDEEEVDAFLDIVEVELSRLIEENNDLRSRAAGGSGAPVAVSDASAEELQAAREDNRRLQAHIAELERTVSQGSDGAQQQLVQLQQQLAQTEQNLAENRRQLEQAMAAAEQARTEANQAREQAAQHGGAAAADHPPAGPESHAKAVQVLALAQQTADQHLAQSKAEAERLLAEAKSTADSTLAEAQQKAMRNIGDAEARARQLEQETSDRANQTVQDAEQRAATITAQFEQRKAALERRVEELRTFEREYRTRLKSYLESQLRDLDASGRAEPAGSNSKTEYADA